MKKRKALSLALIFMLILQIFVLPCQTTAMAAAKNGLQKRNGKTCLYKKGKMVKNKWASVNNHTYYFGSDGAAYKGYKKVGKYRYYFDPSCRMVSNKIVKIKGKKYFFMYNGRAPKRAVMVKGKVWKTTSGGKLVKNISSLAKEGKNFQAFQKAAGKPVRKDTMSSCYGPGKDVNCYYDNFAVATYAYNGSQKILGIMESTE